MTSQRRAVSVAFLAFGVVSGSFIPRLPAIKDHLHLSDGQVGDSLLVFAVGAVVGATLARFLLGSGARRFVRAGTPVLGVALVTLGLAANLPELMFGMVLNGFCAGVLDVLENAQGAELERLAERPLINGFHAFWSLGAVVGSVAAAFAAYFAIAPLAHFAAIAVVVALGSAWLLRDLPDTRSGGARVARPGAGRLWLTGPIAAVAVVALAGYIVEGGTADWSTLYLRDLSHVNAGVAAAGYGGFMLAAMLTRFRADLLTARIGGVMVARLGALLGAVGLAVAIGFPALAGAGLGFALVGIGTAVILPLAFAAGANLGTSGTALAFVMSSGYAGSVVGPALIGNTADRFGLRVAMLIPLGGALVIALLAGNLRPAPQSSEASPVHDGPGSRSEGLVV
ncbi:MAG TPA: MFS transporter [Candidatus Dormibacteraeota bacterium]|nr:MFS transporter [Candidatus Dormibacteraeota bacterium]